MQRLPTVMVNEAILDLKEVALRQECKPVNLDDPAALASAQALIQQLFRTLYSDPSGVALAAPQVGVLLRVAVISYQDIETHEDHLMALINPQITQMSEEKDISPEICLSVPNLSGDVARSTKITVEAYDQHGQPLRFTAEGFLARVIQHEVDHLNGIIYPDRVEGELRAVEDFPERRTAGTIRKLGLVKKK